MKRGIKHSDSIIVIALVVLFTVIIAANARLVSRTLSSQTKRVGETQLSSIKSDLENYISESENALIKTASGAEQIIAAGGDMDSLEEYIVRQKKLQLETSDGTNFNVYIAGQGWAIIPDFDMPSDYHATERLWYVGAVEAAGEIYITDPYIDSMTGDMCYTLSVLLSDNDTVVAMDFTLGEIQRFIDKMSSGAEESSGALIVTDEGMIVGYNDMSYVGKSIKKDLTEYSYIFSYIISYPDENSFMDEVNGKKCRIFHSDTRNGWHMILAVYYDELFGNTTRQIVINIITSVIMLLLIVILYIRNAGNRNKTEEALRSRERFVEKLSDNLREPLGEVIRLSDADIANSSDEVRENLSLIKTAGIRMDEMVKDLSSYSTIVSDMNKEDMAKKSRSKNLSKKIRVLRNAIIVLLIFVTFISSFTLYDAYRSQANENVKRQLTKYNADFNVWETEQKTILHIIELEGDDAVIALSAAAVMTKLLQIANGCVYTAAGAVEKIHEAKAEALAEIVDTTDSPVLVFYSYRHDLGAIQAAIPGARILDGPTWSLELYQQANARLHRQGQEKPVIVHHLIAEGTVDEQVMRALQHKDTSQAALLAALKERRDG